MSPLVGKRAPLYAAHALAFILLMYFLIRGAFLELPLIAHAALSSRHAGPSLFSVH